MITFLSVVLLSETIKKVQYIGFIISFLGFLWIFFRGEFEGLLSLSFNIGDIFVFIAAILWSIYSVLLKIAGPILPKKATFCVTVILGILILVPFALIEELFSPKSWDDLIYI
jgi:drug/metabolite transporter (DMT)-like permease